MAFAQTDDGLGRAAKGARDGPRPLREHTRRSRCYDCDFWLRKKSISSGSGNFSCSPVERVFRVQRASLTSLSPRIRAYFAPSLSAWLRALPNFCSTGGGFSLEPAVRGSRPARVAGAGGRWPLPAVLNARA